MISQRAKRAGLKELEIFDNFYIDRNLPKHIVETPKEMGNSISFNTDSNSAWITVPMSSEDGDMENYEKTSLRTRIGNWILKVKTKKRKKISIIDFFTSLSKSY